MNVSGLERQAAPMQGSGYTLSGAGNIAVPPSETVSSRLGEAGKVVQECVAIAMQIGEHLGLSPIPSKDAAGGPGLAGVTMALRSEVMILRGRLQEIAGAL